MNKIFRPATVYDITRRGHVCFSDDADGVIANYKDYNVRHTIISFFRFALDEPVCEVLARFIIEEVQVKNTYEADEIAFELYNKYRREILSGIDEIVRVPKEYPSDE